MSADTPHPSSPSRRPGRGLLGWLGLSGDDDALADGPLPAPDHAGDDDDPVRLAKRQLMADVTQFLISHDLEISPFTMGLAHDYFTGNDGQIMRRIEGRIQSGEPITVEWLEETVRETRGEPHVELARLMSTLENNIEEFDRTSTAARSAACHYGTALEAHVEEMNTEPEHAGLMVQLVGLARDMLTRTRELEGEMARSMLETKALRRSLDQARRSAEKDHLTGLPNRRAFENRLAAEYAAAREAQEHLCVAFCDIDNFKRINDEHGHEAGDRVLKTVAGNLARISNDQCHVARHGGEEFVVLFRGPSLHEAWEILDDTRSQMAERRLVNRQNDTPFGKVTFSGGVADVFAYADARAALRAADKALYRAKAEGRNRIAIADREAAPPMRKAS